MSKTIENVLSALLNNQMSSLCVVLCFRPCEWLAGSTVPSASRVGVLGPAHGQPTAGRQVRRAATTNLLQ